VVVKSSFVMFDGANRELFIYGFISVYFVFWASLIAIFVRILREKTIRKYRDYIFLIVVIIILYEVYFMGFLVEKEKELVDSVWETKAWGQ